MKSPLARASLMLKPVGDRCDLRCTYCYYTSPGNAAPRSPGTMSEATLESVFAGYLPSAPEEVVISWQGGEPTLAGIAFYERAVALQERHRRPGQRIANAIQTNGTRLDDEWARFLARAGFLVGVSVDGPPRHHDGYRRDAAGSGTRARVERGLDHLRRRGVAFNLVCVLHDGNVQHPVELYESLRELGTPWLQFVPAIEWIADGPAAPQGATPAADLPRLAPFAPSPEDYGRFLCRVFDRWLGHHVRTVSVRLFDALLWRRVRGDMPYCVLGSACDAQITIEAGGDVYPCDHFARPEWRLGQVDGADWPERIDAGARLRFAATKSSLPAECRRCRWRELCGGGCPKHRPATGNGPRPSVLCDAYRTFFDHAMPRLDRLAGELRRGAPPSFGRA